MAKQKARETVKALAVPASKSGGRSGAVNPQNVKADGKRKIRRREATVEAIVTRRPKRAAKTKSKVEDRAGRKIEKHAVAVPAPAIKTTRHKLGRRPLRISHLERLELAIEEVRLGGRISPRTRKLQSLGIPKMAQKVIEEAGEVAIEALQANKTALVNETVDLFYNVVALLSASGVSLEQVWAEMDRRELTLGMAEKLPKIIDPEV